MKILKNISIGFVELFVVLGVLCAIGNGCDYDTITPKDYTSTNSPPSRFHVESSDMYHMQFSLNMTITVFSDTQGTNDFMVIQDGNGLTTMYIPKPVKQLEDWKTK